MALLLLVRPAHALATNSYNDYNGLYARQDACTVLMESEFKVLGVCDDDGPSECTCSEGLYTFRRALWTCLALVNPLQDDGGFFQEAVEQEKVCLEKGWEPLCDAEDDNWQCLADVIGNGWSMPTTVVQPPTAGSGLDMVAWQESCETMDGIQLAEDLTSVSISPADFGYPEWKCLATGDVSMLVTVLVEFPEFQPPMPTSSGACFGKDAACYVFPDKCCTMLADFANKHNLGAVSKGYSAMDQVLDCARSGGLSNDECNTVRQMFSIETI